MIEDLRYAVRLLRKKPGFFLIVILTLSVSIGSATAIFSIVDQSLLKPLPFPQPERLISFASYYSRQTMRGAFSPPTFVDFRESLRSFRILAATAPWNANVTGSGEPQRVEALRVSPGFFEATGILPVLGRSFRMEEEQTGKDQVVVLSNRLWKQQFGGKKSIIGKRIFLNDLPYTVVGVMPEGFRWGWTYGRETDVALWAPLALTPDLLSESSRGWEYLDLIGRLHRGVTLQHAQTEVETLCRRLHAMHPDYYRADTGWVFKLRSLQADMVAEIRPFLITLFVAVSLMLLIAGNNIAGLYLLRGAQRQRDYAIRSALGAGRLQLARHIVIESLILIFAGGSIAAILAAWGLHLFSVLQNSPLPHSVVMRLDLRFFGALFLFSLLAGCLFALLPALRLTQDMPYETLKEGGRSAGAGLKQHNAVHILVLSQIAASLVLLMGASLLMQSFRNLMAVPPGFNIKNIATVAMPMSPARFPQEKRPAFLNTVLDRIKNIPGVASVAATGNLPLSGDENSTSFMIQGRPLKKDQPLPVAESWVITPGYFATMGIPLRSGRDFSNHDTSDSKMVVIIDEVFAARYWPQQNAIGQRLSWDGEESNPVWCEVVGVVGQVKHRGLEDDARPQFYIPYPQNRLRNMTLVIRTSGDPALLGTSLSATVQAIEPNQPLYRFATMEQLLSRSTLQRRIIAQLMSAFAIFALFLSALGLFGVLASAVANRTQEIGLRMILGAQRADILKLILRRAMTLTASGILIGLAIGLPASRFLQSLMFQVRPADPAIVSLVTGAIILAALLASYIPARRATGVVPTEALRYE